MTPLISPSDIAREPDAFPDLTEEDLAIARSCGSMERRGAGEALFVAGERRVDFFIILSGRVEILDTSGDLARLIVIHGPGSIIGDINLFLERPAVAECRVLDDAEIVRLTVAQLRRLLVRSANLSEKWIKALLRRRELMEITGFEGLRIFGEHNDPATLRLREFLHRNGVAHRWIDTAAPENAALVTGLDKPVAQYPAVVWGHFVILENPAVRELATRIGICSANPGRTVRYRDHRQWSRWIGRSGVCGFGRLAHAGSGSAGAGRAGGIEFPDRKFRRLPGGHFWA